MSTRWRNNIGANTKLAKKVKLDSNLKVNEEPEDVVKNVNSSDTSSLSSISDKEEGEVAEKEGNNKIVKRFIVYICQCLACSLTRSKL